MVWYSIVLSSIVLISIASHRHTWHLTLYIIYGIAHVLFFFRWSVLFCKVQPAWRATSPSLANRCGQNYSSRSDPVSSAEGYPQCVHLKVRGKGTRRWHDKEQKSLWYPKQAPQLWHAVLFSEVVLASDNGLWNQHTYQACDRKLTPRGLTPYSQR